MSLQIHIKLRGLKIRCDKILQDQPVVKHHQFYINYMAHAMHKKV